MGQYSYSQPSSSEDSDEEITSFLQGEADLYREHIAEQSPYPPQLEADEGIPKTCYCGGDPVVATAYTTKDPGRRYYMCENADDGYCHVWKWWDVAVTEEINELERQIRMLKKQHSESEQKVLKLEETVTELSKKKARVIRDDFQMFLCLLLSVFIIIMVRTYGE